VPVTHEPDADNADVGNVMSEKTRFAYLQDVFFIRVERTERRL